MLNNTNHNAILLITRVITITFLCLLFFHLLFGNSLGIKYYAYSDGKYLILSRILLLIPLFKKQNFKYILALDIGILWIWVFTITHYHQDFSDIKNINHFFTIIFGHFASGIVYFYVFYNMLLANYMIYYTKTLKSFLKRHIILTIICLLYVIFFIINS